MIAKPLRFSSPQFRLIDEAEIMPSLTPRQRGGSLLQIVYPSGRDFCRATFAEIASASPGGWFCGIVRKGHFWGVMLLVAPERFIHRRDSMRGYTHTKLLLSVDRWLERDSRQKSIERKRKIAVANANGDLRRIRELYASGSHTEQDWDAMVRACSGKCQRCNSAGPLTKDHVIPLARGGGNSVVNLQPLCRSCNSWKGTHTIDFRDHSCPKIINLLGPNALPCAGLGGEGRQGDVDPGAPRP